MLGMLLLLVAVTTPAPAQESRIAAGPKGGFFLEKAYLMLGMVGEYPLEGGWMLVPAVEYVAGISETTRIILDGNLHYLIPLRGSTTRPFLLGGAGVRFDFYKVDGSSEASFRLNLGGGVSFNSAGAVQPWAGVKIFFLDVKKSDLCLQGGVNFVL
jgi:hypothetical protein